MLSKPPTQSHQLLATSTCREERKFLTRPWGHLPVSQLHLLQREAAAAVATLGNFNQPLEGPFEVDPEGLHTTQRGFSARRTIAQCRVKRLRIYLTKVSMQK